MQATQTDVFATEHSALARPDGLLCFALVSLLLLGILAVFTSSIEIAAEKYQNPGYFLMRHMSLLSLGLGAAFVALFVPVRYWQKWSAALLLLAVVLLVLVLIPGVGVSVNGSRRWLAAGVTNIQVSELAKLCLVMYLAAYLVRREQEVRSHWWGFLKPIIVLLPISWLLLKEPDFGAFVVISCTAMGMLFLGGVKLGQFFLIILISCALLVAALVTEDYRLRRLAAFTDPWAAEHVYGSGYQLAQSLIAFGRGELFGLGLGNSVQKLFFLPEAHTDFVFAILAEELGLLAMLLVLLLYSLLVWRIFVIGFRAAVAGQLFAGYLCTGIALLLAAQTLINVGVNIGLLPTKGLTLPFLSYGGSSLLVNCVALALVFRVDYENRKLLLNSND